MLRMIIPVTRDGYDPSQITDPFTIGDLRSFVESTEDLDDEIPIYLSHDNGYTYGSINFIEDYIEEEDEEDDEED